MVSSEFPSGLTTSSRVLLPARGGLRPITQRKHLSVTSKIWKITFLLPRHSKNGLRREKRRGKVLGQSQSGSVWKISFSPVARCSIPPPAAAVQTPSPLSPQH